MELDQNTLYVIKEREYFILAPQRFVLGGFEIFENKILVTNIKYKYTTHPAALKVFEEAVSNGNLRIYREIPSNSHELDELTKLLNLELEDKKYLTRKVNEIVGVGVEDEVI